MDEEKKDESKELKTSDKSDRPPKTTPTQFIQEDKYGTALYRQIGIPTCKICGEKKRTVEGQQICPLSQPNCPFIKQGAI